MFILHISSEHLTHHLSFQKVGDNKESMRTKIRSIMKQICRIYPASKMFNYVMKGVESKNARTRTECLDELGFLVQRNGLSVCNPPKCFPLIASQIGDRDAGVRNAALGAITQGYLLVGDQIFKYLGRLSDKDKSLLEEKLKRLPAAGSSASSAAAAVAIVSSSYDRPKDISRSQTPSILQQAVVAEAVMESSQESRPASSTPVSSKSTSASGIRKEFSLDLDKLDISKFSSGNSTSSSSSNIAELDRSSAPMSAVPSTAATSAFEHRDAMMDFIITQITDTDIDLSINALKQLEKTLSSNPEKLAVYIDDIINATTMQVRIAFTTADLSSHSTSRLCKHLVNMLVQIFSSSELPKRLSNEPLRQCIQELLNRLLDPSLPSIENGTQLTRALNVLMVRILDNSNRNSVFR